MKDIDVQIQRAKDYLKSENEKIDKIEEILESYPPTGADERRYYAMNEEIEKLRKENKQRAALTSYVEANKKYFQETYKITEYTEFYIDTRFYDGFLHTFAMFFVHFPPKMKVGNDELNENMQNYFQAYLNFLIKKYDFSDKLKEFNQPVPDIETKDVAFLQKIDDFFSDKESKEYKKLEKCIQNTEKLMIDVSSFVMDD